MKASYAIPPSLCQRGPTGVGVGVGGAVGGTAVWMGDAEAVGATDGDGEGSVDAVAEGASVDEGAAVTVATGVCDGDELGVGNGSRLSTSMPAQPTRQAATQTKATLLIGFTRPVSDARLDKATTPPARLLQLTPRPSGRP